MSQMLLMLLPEECYPLIMLGAGFAVMFGLLSFQRALGIIIGLSILLALAPVIDSLLDILPGWVLFLLLAWFCVGLFDAVFGRRVRDHVTGDIISAFILALISMPFRILGALFGLRGRR